MGFATSTSLDDKKVDFEELLFRIKKVEFEELLFRIKKVEFEELLFRIPRTRGSPLSCYPRSFSAFEKTRVLPRLGTDPGGPRSVRANQYSRMQFGVGCRVWGGGGIPEDL
jgi:hypothetical protein